MEILLIFILAVIGALMFQRLTEMPFRVRFTLLESAANTYTEVELTLPFVGITGGRSGAQAIELMKVFWQIPAPDGEVGQLNRVDMAIHKDTETGILAFGSEGCIDFAANQNHNVLSGTDGMVSQLWRQVEIHDLTDGDGHGQLIAERSVFAAIDGTGNPSAKQGSGYMLCHLVKLDSDELAAQLLSDDL